MLSLTGKVVVDGLPVVELGVNLPEVPAENESSTSTIPLNRTISSTTAEVFIPIEENGEKPPKKRRGSLIQSVQSYNNCKQQQLDVLLSIEKKLEGVLNYQIKLYNLFKNQKIEDIFSTLESE